MNSRIPLFFGTALGVLLLESNEPAVAQDPQAGLALEEVVVTARRREESLMDTPVSISAFTADELALRQIERSHEIGEATPNLVYRNVKVGSNTAAVVFIRGIGQVDAYPTLQPGVGTYLDGVYVSTVQGAVSEIVDTESISVLRGPQGTLFGRNTIGGAIQITTVKPSDEFHGDVDLELGEDGYEKLKATVNVPFTDNFYGRFSVLSLHEDGYIDTPLIPGDEGKPGDDTKGFRAALRWLPTDALTIDWTVDVSNRKDWGEPIVMLDVFEEIGPAPQNNFDGSVSWQYNNIIAPIVGLPLTGDQYAVAPGDYVNFGDFFVRGKNEVAGSTLTVEWDISDNLTFKSISNHRELEAVNARDGDLSPADVQRVGGKYDGWQRTQEFQLLGTALDSRLNWVAGLYHFDEDMLNIGTPVAFPFFELVSGVRAQNKSNAIFGQFTYDLTDRVSLTLGVRTTDEKFDAVIDDNIQYITALFNPMIPGGYLRFPPNTNLVVPKGVFEFDESRTEPYANLAYQFTDTLMGYVSYSEGFKGGGFVQRITPGQPVFSFGPEYAEVWEVGAKWTGWDGRLRLTTAVFNTDYQDMQVPAASLIGAITVNGGDSEINGGELEVTVAATDRLTFSAGLGHLQARYVSFRDINDINGNPAVVTFGTDDVVPDTPDWQTNASVMYRTPLAGGELIARLDHSYSDVYFTNAQNDEGTLVPSSSIFHGGVTYVHGSDRWEVALQARNLTDEFHIVDLAGDRFVDGLRTAIVMPPRQLHARFKYRF